MREIRRTKTSTVTREWRRQAEVTVWCADCNAPTRFVEPEAAAQLTGVSRRQIYRQLEAGQYHFFETAEGLVFICVNTLTGANALPNQTLSLPLSLEEPS